MNDDNTAGADSLLERLLRRLPGGNIAQEQLERIERRLLSGFKYRLDRLEPSLPALALVSRREANGDSITGMPGELLRDLLAHSQDQSREQAETAYFLSILRMLVPDQARILAALSDGGAYPLIHVVSGSLLGLSATPVLECISNVGKSAGVQCHELTPVYIQQLRALGLVDVDGEPLAGAHTVKYEILETDTAVRLTLERLKQRGRRGRVARRTLKLSAFGERLWAVCQPAEE